MRSVGDSGWVGREGGGEALEGKGREGEGEGCVCVGMPACAQRELAFRSFLGGGKERFMGLLTGGVIGEKTGFLGVGSLGVGFLGVGFLGVGFLGFG